MHVVVVVVMMMMMMMMMMVMHLMRHRSGGGRFLSDSVACKADCESGGSDKALDHGSTVLGGGVQDVQTAVRGIMGKGL